MASPFADTTHLGRKIRASTVKLIMQKSVWTGCVIGSKNNKSLVLTIAHEFYRAQSWLPIEEIEEGVQVQFYGDADYYTCRVGLYLPESDILVLVVDGKSSDEILEFHPDVDNLLTESQLIATRGHPQGGLNWTLMEGKVCTPRALNIIPVKTLYEEELARHMPLYEKELARPMPLYEKELVYFEHGIEIGGGYSGGPVVDSEGYLVGMNTGQKMITTYALGVEPAHQLITKEETNIIETYKGSRMYRTPTETLEQLLSAIKVPLGALGYGRGDFVTINVPMGSKFAIHAEYIVDKLLNGGPLDRFLVDAPAPAPAAAGSSSAAVPHST